MNRHASMSGNMTTGGSRACDFKCSGARVSQLHPSPSAPTHPLKTAPMPMHANMHPPTHAPIHQLPSIHPPTHPSILTFSRTAGTRPRRRTPPTPLLSFPPCRCHHRCCRPNACRPSLPPSPSGRTQLGCHRPPTPMVGGGTWIVGGWKGGGGGARGESGPGEVNSAAGGRDGKRESERERKEIERAREKGGGTLAW